MTSDAEVTGFLQMTKAHPIRLLLILHRNDGTRDTPEADPTVPYFKPQHFDPPEMFDDPAEDTDALIRNTAGVGARRLPIKDYTFEERKWRIRKGIQRQQLLLLRMKREHYLKFPNGGTIDSDHEDFCYQAHLKNPVPNNGHQLVKARQVLASGRQVTNAAIVIGVSRLLAKIRGLRAAQTAWEALN